MLSDDLRLLALVPLRYPSFWSRRPVIRMDVAVGRMDEVHSAAVPGLVDALVAALPPLARHACSVGRPGGFVDRLRRGTYAPHVMEHVALALQESVGHDVAFGRARPGDAGGTYTVVFACRHEAVGIRAGAHAFDLVRRAFAGALGPDHVATACAELAALARTPHSPAPTIAAHALVSGGRAAARAAAARALRAATPAELVVDVDPQALLAHGLPWASAHVALLLDASLDALSPRWRDAERASRLVGIVCDAVEATNGAVVAPSDAPLLHAEASSRGLRLWCFTSTGDAEWDATRAVATALEALGGGRVDPQTTAVPG